MNRWPTPFRALAVVFAATTLVTGCGGGGSSAPPDPGRYVPNPAPTPSPTPAPSPAPGPTAPLTPPPAPGPSPTATPSAPVNKNRITTLADYAGIPAQPVGVAVLDSGIDTNHQEFTANGGQNGVGGPIVSGGINTNAAMNNAYPTITGTSSPQNTTDYNYASGESNHGNYVASIIAGNNVGYTGDASLTIEKITTTDTADTATIAYGFGDAARKGMSFANLSYALDPISYYKQLTDQVAAERAAGQTGINNLTDVQYTQYQSVIGHGMGLVIAAGNTGTSFSAAHNTANTWSTSNPLYGVTLIVGALDTTRNALASYSNYAGDDPNVQKRFLVAPGTNFGADPSSDSAYGSFSGTSSAAPVVTAAAATLKSYWSFMTPTQVAQRLLNTADKNFNAQWSLDTCGTLGTLNCGTYYFGQGRLDLPAALAPAGVVVTTTAASVPTASVRSSTGPSTGATTNPQTAPVQAARLVVPAALAPIQRQVRAESVGIQGFDAIGRNYTLDLAPAINAVTDPTQTLGYQMQGFMTDFMDRGRSSFHAFENR